jgi:hypothetical protein
VVPFVVFIAMVFVPSSQVRERTLSARSVVFHVTCTGSSERMKSVQNASGLVSSTGGL